MPDAHGLVRGCCRGIGSNVVAADIGWLRLLGVDPTLSDVVDLTRIGRELIDRDAVERACADPGEVVVYERVIDVDGSSQAFVVVVAPDRSEPSAWSLSVIDATARVASEATSADSPFVGRLAQALDAADFGVVIQDLGGTIVYLNGAGARMYGWSGGDAVGRHITEVVGDADQTMFDELTRRLDQVGSWTGRVENVDRQGRHFPISLHVAIVRDDAGQPVSRLSIATDISDVVLVERRAARLDKLDSLGHLAGGITHDFNNVLTILLGGAEVLAARLRDDRELGPLAQMLVKAALGGADLTNRLLVFASRQSLQPDVLRPAEVVTDMLPLLRRALDARTDARIDVVATSRPGTWAVLADRGQLEVALMNIAVNARDAMRTGGRLSIETSNVTVGAGDAARDYVRLSLADTGTGMSRTVLDHAIEPFYTTKPVGSGSGLGLSMVHGFVQQSGGFVDLRSEPEVGTTVELHLPRADDGRGPLSVASTVPALVHGTESVLVVDDDDLVRSYAAATVRGLGYDVVEAADGAEALMVLRSGAHIDLLFTDVSMPGGMSGIQLVAAARELRPDIAVLLTSGRIDAQGDGELSGRLLRKPYGRAQLADQLRVALVR